VFCLINHAYLTIVYRDVVELQTTMCVFDYLTAVTAGEVLFLAARACLFVCLFVDTATETMMSCFAQLGFSSFNFIITKIAVKVNVSGFI